MRQVGKKKGAPRIVILVFSSPVSLFQALDIPRKTPKDKASEGTKTGKLGREEEELVLPLSPVFLIQSENILTKWD